MKRLSSSRRLFLLGFIVLAVTNIVVLAGVAYNRSGEPEARITLTERELPLPYRRHEENSGLSMHLKWRVMGAEEDYNRYYGWRSPAWLDAEKLVALGFDMEAETHATFHRRPIPKEVFIVLENDGAAYREALESAEKAFETAVAAARLKPGDKAAADARDRAENRLKKERTSESRLFAIDAGLDPEILRKQYEDRARFVIARGLVAAEFFRDKGRKAFSGRISRLSVESIFVPLEFRNALSAIPEGPPPRRKTAATPRYTVTLTYGSRLEPWIAGVQATAEN